MEKAHCCPNVVRGAVDKIHRFCGLSEFEGGNDLNGVERLWQLEA